MTLLIPIGEILLRRRQNFVGDVKRAQFLDPYSPHDSVNHLHDDFVDDVEEVNDDVGLGAEGSQDGPEGQAEEDDAESVGAGTVTDLTGDLHRVRLNVLSMSLDTDRRRVQFPFYFI